MEDSFKESRFEYSDGHQVVFDFHVHWFRGDSIWHTMKDYYSNCHLLPTSWLLEMHIEKALITGDVRILVTLKRNDTIYRPVDVSILIWFNDGNNGSFFDGLRSFGRKFVMPGEKIQEDIIGFIQLSEKRNLFNKELLVFVCIRLRNCHSACITKTITSMNTVIKNKQRSMM